MVVQLILKTEINFKQEKNAKIYSILELLEMSKKNQLFKNCSSGI